MSPWPSWRKWKRSPKAARHACSDEIPVDRRFVAFFVPFSRFCTRAPLGTHPPPPRIPPPIGGGIGGPPSGFPPTFFAKTVPPPPNCESGPGDAPFLPQS